MTARIYREVVNPGKLDETQRGNLASELYAIHARIFHGVQYESFAREVIHSTARLTRIAIYRNRQHEIVGYCAVHFHDSEVFQYSKACVIRAESGILPEYRGSNQSIPFLYRTVEMGPKLEGLRIVRSGLSKGDRIVVNGLQRVRPGMQVDPQKVEMASADTLATLARLRQSVGDSEPPKVAASKDNATRNEPRG